ncbi:hypothetical protein EVAR_53236_1 [Eumeta japonica]|uniref:Uncharacterized protein n=1 Tax=Eumeta variegata TaxID=151549 RepID=A0A4C1XBP7_EUMVA|nr:hypothetical protein EVAR_53236_1 [Eumeta japonica]
MRQTPLRGGALIASGALIATGGAPGLRDVRTYGCTSSLSASRLAESIALMMMMRIDLDNLRLIECIRLKNRVIEQIQLSAPDAIIVPATMVVGDPLSLPLGHFTLHILHSGLCMSTERGSHNNAPTVLHKNRTLLRPCTGNPFPLALRYRRYNGPYPLPRY